MSIDLALLPAPEVIEALSFEAIFADHKADLLARYPAAASVIDLESEPIIKLLEVGAYRELQLRARYNDEARALLLAYATGGDLDHIGATYYAEPRLVITPANPAANPPVLEVLESDEDFRYRLALKPESWSVAGPRDAYKFHALSASGQIKDASVTSPQRGSTTVFVLSRVGNGPADAALITAVDAVLSSDTIRPLSEEVVVSPAEVVDYSIALELVLYSGTASEIALAAARAALAVFAEGNHRLGRDVIRSAISAAAHQPGVKKVTVSSPANDIACSPSQAPYCTAINVIVSGIEE